MKNVKNVKNVKSIVRRDVPRLQNTPVRTDEGRALQRIFSAAGPMVEIDYSSIELRIAAALLKEKP